LSSILSISGWIDTTSSLLPIVYPLYSSTVFTTLLFVKVVDGVGVNECKGESDDERLNESKSESENGSENESESESG
jgi:hypothetical protein